MWMLSSLSSHANNNKQADLLTVMHDVVHAGGSAGIGRATVLQFAAAGAIVCAAARRADRLDAVVAAAPKGATIYRVVLDLTSEDSCRAAVKEAVGARLRCALHHMTCLCLVARPVMTVPRRGAGNVAHGARLSTVRCICLQ